MRLINEPIIKQLNQIINRQNYLSNQIINKGIVNNALVKQNYLLNSNQITHEIKLHSKLNIWY